MEKFKEHWEISKNWQLLFPLFGILVLLFSAYKLAFLFTSQFHIIFSILSSVVIFYLMLSTCLFFIRKLEKKWIVDQKWEMIRIFIVFGITGSTSAFVGRPLIALAGITKENLNPFIYWILFIIIGLIFYQVLLVALGWLFGQFEFFWGFEKKMLRRFGLKRFLED
jgi:hypothetical protein